MTKRRTMIHSLQRTNDNVDRRVTRHYERTADRRAERSSAIRSGNRAARRAEKHAARRPQPAQRYTYADCLRDAVPTPTGANGTTLYQILMVGGTVAFTVTASQIEDSGIRSLEHAR